MTKTASRANGAQQVKSKAKAKPAKEIKIVEVDLGDKGQKILDKMAEHRQVRLAAEREEKLLKDQLKELLPPLKKNRKMIVRAAGIIRGTVSWRRRTNTDLDLLLEGWPEAYEQVTSINEFTQFDPA